MNTENSTAQLPRVQGWNDHEGTIVLCPFCGCIHAHGLITSGTAAAVAHCITGAREYLIVLQPGAIPEAIRARAEMQYKKLWRKYYLLGMDAVKDELHRIQEAGI